MNQEQFLETLREKISFLPENEIEEIISDYQEHFNEAKAQNRTDEDIIKSLGSPSSIAQSYRLNNLINPDNKDKKKNYFYLFAVAIALLFLNYNIVVFPLLIAAIIIIFMWFIPLVGLLLSLSALIKVIFIESVDSLFTTFLSLGFLSLSLLSLIGLWYLSLYFIKIIVKYVGLNIKLVKGAKL